MAGYENIKNKGFNHRTTEELRVITTNGGRASGEARRRKADFRKTLNLLLTAKIDSSEWTPLLESLGLDSTLESALNMAMIKEGLAGNVKAYEAVAKYAGQSAQTESDEDEQKARISQIKAQTERLSYEQPGQDEDGVEIINDAPKEAGKDIGDSDPEVSTDI